MKAGLNGGFKSMGDRMVDANGVPGTWYGKVCMQLQGLEVNMLLVERDGKVW